MDNPKLSKSMTVKAEIDQQREEDLERYKKVLPDCDNFEDRLFFINGIIDLLEKLDQGSWSHAKAQKLINIKKMQGYEDRQIEKKCCIPRGELMNGHYKKIVVGCAYGF